MLTDDEIKAIEARAEAATPSEGWWDDVRCQAAAANSIQDIPALLADRQELLALARELAEALVDTFRVATALDTKLPAGGYAFRTEYLTAPDAIVKARAAGLLEGE